MRTLGFLTTVVFASSSAYAAECETPYTIDAFLEDLTVVELALRESNDPGLVESGARLGAGLGCLDERMPALIAARAYRGVGAGLLADGKPELADKWFLTSLEVDPTWDYGTEDIPDGHPLRPHFDALKLIPAVEPTLVEGKEFADGDFYLNGRKITKPKARLGRNHVFQVQTSTLSTSIIEGNAFPAAVLKDSAVASSGSSDNGKTKKPKKVKTPKDKSGATTDKSDGKVAKAPKPPKSKATNRTKTITLPNGETKVVGIQQRPKEKTPLIIGGAAVIAGSGVLYYFASRTASDLKGITSLTSPGHMAGLNGSVQPTGSFRFCTGDEIPGDTCFADPNTEAENLRERANNLVLASLSMFAVGVGVTTWGVIVEGGTAMPTVNVRF